MQDRDYHLKKAHKTKSETYWSTYRKLRCFVNKKVRECKSKYYENLIDEHNNNPPGLWKTLNELTSRNSQSQPQAQLYQMVWNTRIQNPLHFFSTSFLPMLE
jgi:hypothetical protein